MVFTEFDLAVFTKGHIEHDEQPHTHGGVEQPAHVFHRPGEGNTSHRGDCFRADNPPEHKTDNQCRCDPKNGFINGEFSVFIVNANPGGESRVNVLWV